MNDTTTPNHPQPVDTGADTTGGGFKGATRTIRDEAGKLRDTASEKARFYADDGKARASGALGEVAKLVDDAANTVDERLGEQYGQYGHSAAKFVDDFANTLSAKNVDELLDDTRQFVRKSPVVAIGIAAAIGFAIARVVKAGIDTAADAGERNARKPTNNA